jgi:hypothetical protein
MNKCLVIACCTILAALACRLPTTLSATPTETRFPLCTPPACAEDETYHCPGECPGGCGTVCATRTPTSQPDRWRPAAGITFHIQFEGQPDSDLPVDVYILDLFETSSSQIAVLHRQGKAVVCYFSAGSFEDWRPDVGLFPTETLGRPLEGWEGETWLDIRQIDQLAPVMLARLDLAAQKGCDGVDPDNLDAYANPSGFDLSYANQLAYNTWLAEKAHQRGLAIGLKNDLGQVADLVDLFDFSVNEECYTYKECGLLAPFIQQNKPVFGIEYDLMAGEFCPQANAAGFSFIRKNLALDADAVNCWEQ